MQRPEPMSDPTFFILRICLFVALGVFVAVALWRGLRRRMNRPPVLEAVAEPPSHSQTAASGESYAPPATPAPLPPPLPGKGVPIWPYHVIDLLWMGFLFLTFSALALTMAAASGDEARVPGLPDLIVSIGFQFILAGATIGVVAWRVHPAVWLGLKWPQWPWVLLIAPATVVAMWIVFTVIGALGYMEWMKSLGVDPVQNSVRLLQSANDPVLLATMGLAAVVVAPLCEEVIFRGYLYPAAKKFAGPWVAAGCTSLVFAAAHGSLAALLPLFILSLVLVTLYEKTRSIWAPVGVHLCFNGATVAVQALMRYLEIPIEP